jgi:hypothetical protein
MGEEGHRYIAEKFDTAGGSNLPPATNRLKRLGGLPQNESGQPGCVH